MSAELVAEQDKGLMPERELFTDDGEYHWFVYPAELTGLRLVCLEDLDTGVIVTTTVSNPEKRTAAHRAWAGARHSRAPGTPWEIMHEMGEKGVDPDARPDELFTNYGHASVGDMASLEASVVRCPMHLCFSLFNDSAINSGQEKSTRYQQRFKVAILHGIRHYLPQEFHETELESFEAEYQEFGQLSLELFAKHQRILASAFTGYYQPETKREEKSLDSRVLDCVRFFLLFGQGSGLSFETSARDWSRIIGDLKASHLAFYNKFGTQLERLFAPTKEEEEALGYRAEAPGLIRHTQPSLTTNNNLERLKSFIEGETNFLDSVSIERDFRGRVVQGLKLLSSEFSEADKMVAQYFLTLWPGASREETLDWIRSQENERKLRISRIIFSGHDNYHEMSHLARTSGITLAFEGFLGEVRDWDRHRAWGRMVTLPLVFGPPVSSDTSYQILGRGYGLPLYLSEVDEFEGLGKDFGNDLDIYYTKLYNFVHKASAVYGDSIDYSFVVNLLPLAHQVTLWMHGDPKQALYMTHQRARPGGHINYRMQAYYANQLMADSGPYLEGMRVSRRPDPRDRDEFFNRS